MTTLRPQPGRWRTRERNVRRGVARCPFPSCTSAAEPLFCATHWPHVTSATRRAMLAELKVLKARQQRHATPRLGELLREAISEVQRAQYKATAVAG